MLYEIVERVGRIFHYQSSVIILERRKRITVVRMFSSRTTMRGGANNLYMKCGYCPNFYLRGCANSHSCFLKSKDSLFGDASKRSSTIRPHNVFYDIESRLEKKFECKFQKIDPMGNVVTLLRSKMFDSLEDIEKFKVSLTEDQKNCMEVTFCKSHQPTLLCVVNGSQSLKRHFCEAEVKDVMMSFF